MRRLTYLCFVALSVTAIACGGGKKHKNKNKTTSTTSTTGSGGSGGESTTNGTGGDGTTTTGNGTGGETTTSGTGGTGGEGTGGTGGEGTGGAPGGAGGMAAGGEGGSPEEPEGNPTLEAICEIKDAVPDCDEYDGTGCVASLEDDIEAFTDIGCGDEYQALLECEAELTTDDFECYGDSVEIDYYACEYPAGDFEYCFFMATNN